MLKKVVASMKRINYRLFLALLLMGLIPTIYTTVRIFFLGQLPGDWGFNIASQLSWVNLLYEIVQEALILPLFFFIGKSLTDQSELENKVKTGLILTAGIYAALSLLIMIFAVPMIRFMAQDVTLIDETAAYIRLETIAAVFSTLVRFVTIVLITIKKEKYLYAILGVQMILSIILDTFFVSSLDISLNLGVNGIAITNIIVNVLLLGLALLMLRRENIYIFRFEKKLSFRWIGQWAKVGGISGLESFVRNFAFMMMIVRMVNVVGEQGTFWVANNFIWGWLLLPVLQLGELVKRDCGENEKAVAEKSLGYFGITAIIVVLWFVSLPLWKPFMQNVLQLSNYEDIFYIVLISVGFYVFFAFNNVIDSIFYGLGRTDYMLFQSLVINIIFYGGAFVFYITGIYEPTLTKIAIMFAAGTALDSILTFFMYVRMLKKRQIELC